MLRLPFPNLKLAMVRLGSLEDGARPAQERLEIGKRTRLDLGLGTKGFRVRVCVAPLGKLHVDIGNVPGRGGISSLRRRERRSGRSALVRQICGGRDGDIRARQSSLRAALTRLKVARGPNISDVGWKTSLVTRSMINASRASGQLLHPAVLKILTPGSSLKWSSPDSHRRGVNLLNSSFNGHFIRRRETQSSKRARIPGYLWLISESILGVSSQDSSKTLYSAGL
ncbi:hypothetical protein C8F01DRAFT_1369641 [Mycena amicta]|nr:hypothetical protein C8F01DRAFT_1369641 [Mycena amicta]